MKSQAEQMRDVCAEIAKDRGWHFIANAIRELPLPEVAEQPVAWLVKELSKRTGFLSNEILVKNKNHFRESDNFRYEFTPLYAAPVQPSPDEAKQSLPPWNPSKSNTQMPWQPASKPYEIKEIPVDTVQPDHIADAGNMVQPVAQATDMETAFRLLEDQLYIFDSNRSVKISSDDLKSMRTSMKIGFKNCWQARQQEIDELKTKLAGKENTNEL